MKQFLSVLVFVGTVAFGQSLYAQAVDVKTLDDKALAEEVLAAIGADVPHTTNKCAGCHTLDAQNLRRWVDTTSRVKNECFAHYNENKNKGTAEGALKCLSGNAPTGFPWRPKHLGLWAARITSGDFDEVFTAYFEDNAESELNKLRQFAYMPRNGGPGFSNTEWDLITEWISRGAPLLEETLSPVAVVKPTQVRTEVILDNLNSPWAVVTAPNNDIWITEIDGRIKIYNQNFELQRTLTNFPEINPTGQGGLLDIAFHPKFAQNGWIYANYTVRRNNGYNTRVNRFTYKNGELTEHKIILEGPTGSDGAHFGSRLVFGNDGYLYATFGERHLKEKAQSLNSLHGKTVRIGDDGSIPADNPFENNPIFTLGHRNPQGIALDPVSGNLFTSEHGPTGYDAPGGGDEVNLLKAGANYGWPVIHHNLTQEGMESPIAEYTPAIAPSGITFYTGNLIPQWKNDLFMTALRGARLVRLRIKDGKVTEQENLLVGKFGRIRDVGNGPDGSLLIVTDGGELVRLK